MLSCCVSQALMQNATLTQLSLQGSAITQDGASVLLKAGRSSPQLRERRGSFVV